MFARLPIASTLLAAALTLSGPAGAQTGGASTERQFHIVTVHIDGMTGLTATALHPAESFPTGALPVGGGMIRTPPNADGEWRMRVFVFQPAQVVVRQDDQVTLTFVGVHGPSFRILVDGQAEPVALRRGETASVRFTASQPGRIGFRAEGRAPTMVGEVLVLPR